MNYRGTFSQLSAVAEFGANPTGICDLVGNAYDLCLDPSAGAGEGSLSGRGGSWSSPRTELDEPLPIDWRSCRPDVGFRCVTAAARPGGSIDAENARRKDYE